MLSQHLTQLEHARIFTAAVLVLLGVLEIAGPSCIWGFSVYFKGTRAALGPQDRERLARVLAARRNAEGDTDLYVRVVGVFTILMAPLVLIEAVPYVLPYALSCVTMAIAILFSYLRFRRATQRRVAPLVRRSVWASLPPLAVAATATCLAGTAAFTIYPQLRLSAVIVIAAAVVLVAIAWRVAVAPAILFGNDSALEYRVDEHLRLSRATGLITLACAPLMVFVGLGWATLPPDAHSFDIVALVVLVSFFTALAFSFNPMRKRITLA